MRVRVLRWTDPTSSLANLVIDRWCSGQWERVPDLVFGLHQSERANEIAMGLSLSKRIPVEIAVFQDGDKLEPARGVDVFNRQHGTEFSDIGEKTSESQP